MKFDDAAGKAYEFTDDEATAMYKACKRLKGAMPKKHDDRQNKIKKLYTAVEQLTIAMLEAVLVKRGKTAAQMEGKSKKELTEMLDGLGVEGTLGGTIPPGAANDSTTGQDNTGGQLLISGLDSQSIAGIFRSADSARIAPTTTNWAFAEDLFGGRLPDLAKQFLEANKCRTLQGLRGVKSLEKFKNSSVELDQTAEYCVRRCIDEAAKLSQQECDERSMKADISWLYDLLGAVYFKGIKFSYCASQKKCLDREWHGSEFEFVKSTIYDRVWEILDSAPRVLLALELVSLKQSHIVADMTRRLARTGAKGGPSQTDVLGGLNAVVNQFLAEKSVHTVSAREARGQPESAGLMFMIEQRLPSAVLTPAAATGAKPGDGNGNGHNGGNGAGNNGQNGNGGGRQQYQQNGGGKGNGRKGINPRQQWGNGNGRQQWGNPQQYGPAGGNQQFQQAQMHPQYGANRQAPYPPHTFQGAFPAFGFQPFQQQNPNGGQGQQGQQQQGQSNNRSAKGQANNAQNPQ